MYTSAKAWILPYKAMLSLIFCWSLEF